MSEDRSFNLLTGINRLGDCEVCGGRAAKYKCPACEVRTCSLPCVSIHKKELDCTGQRSRVHFKHLANFSDVDLQSDYMLLEEMGRSVERIVRGRRPLQKNMAFKWQKLKSHLWKRGTQLQFLPPKFSKHIHNTSFLNWQTNIVYWKLEWLFPQAKSFPHSPIVDKRADETCLVEELLQKYLNEKSEFSEELKPYIESEGMESIKVLMKAERVQGGNKYLLISPSLSLSENLQGKLIVEHPTFYVIHTSHVHEYHIVTAESIHFNEESKRNRRNIHYRNNSSMKFFSDNLSDSDSA